MEKLYANLTLPANQYLISDFEKSVRNYASLDDARRDGEVKPEYKSVYDEWKLERKTSAEASAYAAANNYIDLSGLWNFIQELTGNAPTTMRKNRTTTAESSAFLTKYSTWANNVSDQLVAYKNKIGANGDPFTYSATYPKSV